MPNSHQRAFDNFSILTVRDLRQPSRLRDAISLKLGALDDRQFHAAECTRHAQLFASLVEDVLGRRYEDVTLRCFTHVCAALEYLLDPSDERPDLSQRGFEDDAKRLRETHEIFRPELTAYEKWRKQLGTTGH